MIEHGRQQKPELVPLFVTHAVQIPSNRCKILIHISFGGSALVSRCKKRMNP